MALPDLSETPLVHNDLCEDRFTGLEVLLLVAKALSEGLRVVYPMLVDLCERVQKRRVVAKRVREPDLLSLKVSLAHFLEVRSCKKIRTEEVPFKYVESSKK